MLQAAAIKRTWESSPRLTVFCFITGSTLEDILAAVRDQPDSIGADVEDDDDEDSDTSGEEEKDQVCVGPCRIVD